MQESAWLQDELPWQTVKTSRAIARGIGGVGLAALFHSLSATAQPPSGFSLDWNAPAGCPQSTFVLAEMSRLLGREPGLPSDRPVSLRAAVEPTGSAFTVRILLTTPEGRGERTFRNASCERVALATALVASLAIDPETVAARKAEPPPAPPESPHPPPQPVPPKMEIARTGQRDGFSLGAEPGIDLGILPSLGVRLAVVAGLSWRSFRYEGVVGYDLPQVAHVPGEITRGARLQLGTLKVRACLAPIEGTVEMDACLSIEGGLFFATGVGISAPASKTYPWVAGLAGPRLVWHWARWLEGRLEADVGASLVRPTFEITGSAPAFVYRPSLFHGQATASALVRFR
jgi:hypothetical protein